MSTFENETAQNDTAIEEVVQTEVETEVQTAVETSIDTETFESVAEVVETGDLLTTDIYRDEEFTNRIETMTFVELFNLGATMKNEIEEMKAAKETVEQMLEMDKSLAAVNDEPFTDSKYTSQKQDMEKFLEDYPGMLKTLMGRMLLLEDKLKTYGDVCTSTTFLTGQLKETVEKRLGELEKIDDEKYMNKETDIKRLNIRKNALENRHNLDFIDGKTNIPKVLKNMIKDSYNQNLFNNTVKDFERIFKKDSFKDFLRQINAFNVKMGEPHEVEGKPDMMCCDNVYDVDPKKWLPACQGFLYHMTKLIVNGQKDGTFIYPKLLIMNLLDISNGIYDLEGGKDAYVALLKDVIKKYVALI